LHKRRSHINVKTKKGRLCGCPWQAAFSFFVFTHVFPAIIRGVGEGLQAFKKGLQNLFHLFWYELLQFSLCLLGKAGLIIIPPGITPAGLSIFIYTSYNNAGFSLRTKKRNQKHPAAADGGFEIV